jgi:hypothetical protein
MAISDSFLRFSGSRDCFAALPMTDPLTPPEKHTDKREEKAQTEPVRNTAVPQQGANNCFLARRSIFLDRGPLKGDPMRFTTSLPSRNVALGRMPSGRFRPCFWGQMCSWLMFQQSFVCVHENYVGYGPTYLKSCLQGSPYHCIHL